ncbi:MAG: MerR family transcriptional regulator [Dissulfurimicrobium sp.]|uniref:MerR family transcriptional regulator n=1 Tax=Dissulfurimicrobium TaxID=1769732 RepID=UPI001EDAB120|nr:MerR family transcriptional regulator [Dissulfurimicrobium hydrothermale]UKL14553.1 MerR family transcriptional regulator [Dissulfurimicrobium hydrothermale]
MVTMTEEVQKRSRHIDDTGSGPVETELWQPIDNVDPDKPIFSIGAASAMLEVHPRTLRIYEEEELIRPTRRGQRRYYSLNDIQWITCLRSMIHDHGVSIAGLKKLLQYTACWNIVKCPMEKRKVCTAYHSLGLLHDR